MRKRILFFVAFAALSTACGITPEVEPGNESDALVETVSISGENIPESARVAGKVNVEVSESLAEELESLTGEDGYVNFTVSKSLTAIPAEMGIRSMRRVFPRGTTDAWEKLAREYGMHRWYALEYDESFPVAGTCSGISAIPGIKKIEFIPSIEIVGNPKIVEYAAEDPIRSATTGKTFFNDPRYQQQWYIYNDGTASSSVSGCDMNVVPVWSRLTTGSPDVIVCVVDGGIDFTHEDIAANMWINDTDTEEYLRYGQNFVSPYKQVSADDHGTHVGGTIGAVSNNGKGIAGIAGGNSSRGVKGVKLMSCQIFEGKNSASGEGAMYWSVQKGAVISQNSWSYTSATSLPETMRLAIDFFIDNAGIDPETKQQTGPMKGGLVLFAAGNENRNWGWPAQYERVVAVSSVAADYRKAYYSNYGDWIDVAATGGDYKKGCQIMSTVPGNKYAYMQGTSMACPCASGVAALILSYFKGQGFTADQLRQKLEAGATDISAFNRGFNMGNLVNAYKSIIGEGGVAPNTPGQITASTNSNNVSFSITVPRDPDEGAAAYIRIYYSKTDFTSTSGLMFANFDTEGLAAGSTFSGSISGLDFESEYWLGAVAIDLGGNASQLGPKTQVYTGSNAAPVLTPIGSTSLELKAGAVGKFNFSAFDPDGHYYNISLEDSSKQEDGSCAASVDTTDRANLKILIYAKLAEPGNYSGTLTITDIYGLSASAGYSYKVLPNNPPYVKEQLASTVFTSKTKGSATYKLTDYFGDPDEEDLTYTAESSVPEICTCTIDALRKTLTVTATDYGYSDITVTAFDARRASAQQSFRLLVKDGSSELDIYPNPVVDYLYVRTGTIDPDGHIKIIGTTGYTIYNEACELSPFNPVQIDLQGFPAGTYTAIVTYKGSEIKKTVVKL